MEHFGRAQEASRAAVGLTFNFNQMDTTVVTQFVKQAQSGSLAGMALFLKELPKAELLAVRANQGIAAGAELEPNG